MVLTQMMKGRKRMADKSKFGFTVTESISLGFTTIKAHASNNIADKLADLCKQLFEIEMHFAITIVEKDITTITFSTYNKDNVEHLSKSLFKTFRSRSELNNINYN